jgi:hypothetical protein
MQFLIEENPYGYTGTDLNQSVELVRQDLESLRAPGLSQAAVTSALAARQHIDGPACRHNSTNTAPDLRNNPVRNGEPLTPQDVYDLTTAGLFWRFKNQQLRVSKAMKLQYSAGGQTYEILIGYVGSGGGM